MDDVEQEWVFQTLFDFVHVRFLAGSIMDWPKLVEQCYKWVYYILPFLFLILTLLNRNTKPGGWVEFKDWDADIISSDNSLPEDSKIYRYHKLLRDGCNQGKRSPAPGPKLKEWAEQAGYVNVTEQVVPIPLGMWPKDKLQV